MCWAANADPAGLYTANQLRKGIANEREINMNGYTDNLSWALI